jgi:hypothetical protein
MYGQSYNNYCVDDPEEDDDYDDYPDWKESQDMEKYYEERYEK